MRSHLLALDMNKVKEACAELVKESPEVAKAVGELVLTREECAKLKRFGG